MTTAELKILIHESVINIEDEKFLKYIYDLLRIKYSPVKEVEMSDYQKKRLEESIKQAERGEYRTSEEVFTDIEQWLTK